jgi:hypothetical protein
MSNWTLIVNTAFVLPLCQKVQFLACVLTLEKPSCLNQNLSSNPRPAVFPLCFIKYSCPYFLGTACLLPTSKQTPMSEPISTGISLRCRKAFQNASNFIVNNPVFVAKKGGGTLPRVVGRRGTGRRGISRHEVFEGKGEFALE